MEGEKLKRRKAILSNKILPYFIGISDDLMFFIAIETLFFTVVKGLSASQITFLTTVTNVSYILMQMPALKIIQKIGNVRAIRLGTIMFLCSSLLITFGNHYIAIIIGFMLYQPAHLFKKMEQVALKNNLTYLNKQDDYIKLANKAHTIYAVITMVIALIAGGIFAINHYLPMYFCIGICVINVLLSFCIFDVGETTQIMDDNKKKVKTKLSTIMIMTFLSFGLLYSIINIGQNNSTLFIQYDLQRYFGIGTTATYLSLIIVTSRIARIFGNIVFKKLYEKYKDKVSLIITAVTILAFGLLLLGSCLQNILIIKFIVMTLGFDLILAVRDPFDTYISDLLLKNTKPKEQQKAVSYLQLTRRIVESMLSLIFSMLLLKINLFFIICILMTLTMISLMINWKLYKLIKEK